MLSVLLRTIAIGLLLSTPTAYSANDIASSPINYLISAQVKPNIFFILDDSGSMQWSYLGDEVVINGYEKTVGYRNSLCNKIYYNPSIVYEPPEQADGTPYIIAPSTSTQNFGTPVVDQYGKIDVSVESFTTILRNGGSSNSLADVASYYFRTDLRQPAFSNCPTEREVCANNVPVAPGSRDGNFQHMVTHTVGLGASGSLHYREDYAEATSGDFAEIVSGRRDWSDPMFYNGPERVDDLWHAAVNGGGRYFNASNPESLSKALSGTLSTIRASIGAAAAASTSSQQPVEGDNLVFASSFRSMYWDGDVEARRINLTDGSLSTQAEWSASTQLDKLVKSLSDKRKIWVQSYTDASLLKNFIWSELDNTEQRLFQNRCTSASRLSQCNNLTSLQRRELTGERLVN